MRISDWSSDVCSSDLSIGWCLKVAVGRIILTCSAVALMALGAPLSAAAVQQDFGAWRAYMRGRAAISQDKLGEAVRQFQTALQASEHDRILRQRTFGLALLSGDEKLSFERSEEHTSELQSLMRISYAVFCLK